MRLVHKLFELTDMKGTLLKNFEHTLGKLKQSAPFISTEEHERLYGLFMNAVTTNVDDLINNRLAPVLEEHVSGEDLQFLYDLYSTERGKRLASLTSTMFAVSTDVTEEWMKEILSKVEL